MYSSSSSLLFSEPPFSFEMSLLDRNLGNRLAFFPAGYGRTAPHVNMRESDTDMGSGLYNWGGPVQPSHFLSWRQEKISRKRRKTKHQDSQANEDLTKISKRQRERTGNRQSARLTDTFTFSRPKTGREKKKKWDGGPILDSIHAPGRHLLLGGPPPVNPSRATTACPSAFSSFG